MCSMYTFCCDVMLGRLALRLRLLGFYCSYSRADNPHGLIVKAYSQGSLFLTRRTRYQNCGPLLPVLFIGSNQPDEQVREVVERLHIMPCNCSPFSCCLNCNAQLQRIEHARAQCRVPDYVFATCDLFSECPQCHKIYWQGTHYYDMLRRIDRLWHEKQ